MGAGSQLPVASATIVGDSNCGGHFLIGYGKESLDIYTKAQGILEESPKGACPSGEDGQAC